MINYIEKGFGLHLAIEEAGYKLESIDGVWIASDDAAVQAIIDSYISGEYERKEALKEIDEAAGEARKRYISDGFGQTAVYLIKAKEADDYLAAVAPTDSDYPHLVLEAAESEKTLREVAQTIAATRDQWQKDKSPKIEGIRRGFKAKLEKISWDKIEQVKRQALARLEAV